MDEEHKTNKQEEANQFSSRIALVCSCLGCVVGTGNIWRFPRIVANNSGAAGGLAFLIVWLLFLFIWSIPMLLIEYGSGRFTGLAVVGSFKQFVGRKAAWCGAWVSMVSFFIASYYAVVLGWCFYYAVYCMANELPDNAGDSRKVFKDYAEDSAWPVLTHGIAVLIAGISILGGVKTIEKVNLVLVPILLVIVLFTFAWSLTREYASVGLTYLFSPDWESLSNPRLWVDALSQNAFDTGAGAGLMVPYASYMTWRNGIVKYGTLIPSTNNLISLISGMMVFATVFSSLILTRPELSQSEIIDIVKDSGPGSTGLTFIWIPVLFSSIGVFGRVICVFFFVCLSCAGVTSLIANIELVAHTLCDFGVPRKIAAPLTTLVIFLVGLLSSLNINILTNQDFVWGFALVLSGLMLQFMVIYYGVSKFREEVFNDFSLDDWHLPRLWDFIVKFLAPLEGVALIIWWAVDLISTETKDGESWYDYGKETFMTTITQWLVLVLILILINVAVDRFWYPPDQQPPEEYERVYDHNTMDNLADPKSEYGSVNENPSKPVMDLYL